MTDDERKASQRERTARYRARHRERVLAQGRSQSKKWHAAHRAESIAASKAYYQKHRDEQRSRVKEKRLLLDRDQYITERRNGWAKYKDRWNEIRRLKRAADIETARRKQREWRAANIEAVRLRAAEWRARPDQRAKAVARTAAWIRAHPEHARALHRKEDAKRRARENDVFVEDVDSRVVFERDGGICGICQTPVELTSRWEIDHIIPIAKRGPHAYANVQLAHMTCNRRKGNRCA